MAARTATLGPWRGIGIGLFVLGSVVLLVANTWVLAVGLQEATAWLAVPGLAAGGAGLVVGLRLRSAPERAATAGGLGLLVLVLDSVGLSGPPRLIPGTLLLAGAAVVAGSRRPAGGHLPPPALVAVVAGAVAHAAVGLAILPFGLVAPAWAIMLLLVAWATLLAVAVRQRRSQPLLFLAAPVLSAALTAGTMYAGTRLLHWMP